MRVLSFSVLVFLAACANPTDDPGLNEDRKPPEDKKPPMAMTGSEIKTGTRLRSRFVNGDDGSQIAVGLYDSKLNIECQFSEAEDGKTRCLPTRTATLKPPEMFQYSYQTRSIFKDSACTERLAFSNLCEDAVRYIKFSDTCGGRTRIANTVEIAVPSTAYYRRADGSCYGFAAASLFQLSELRFYSVGPPVQAQEFASGTIATE